MELLLWDGQNLMQRIQWGTGLISPFLFFRGLILTGAAGVEAVWWWIWHRTTSWLWWQGLASHAPHAGAAILPTGDIATWEQRSCWPSWKVAEWHWISKHSICFILSWAQSLGKVPAFSQDPESSQTCTAAVSHSTLTSYWRATEMSSLLRGRLHSPEKTDLLTHHTAFLWAHLLLPLPSSLWNSNMTVPHYLSASTNWSGSAKLVGCSKDTTMTSFWDGRSLGAGRNNLAWVLKTLISLRGQRRLILLSFPSTNTWGVPTTCQAPF